MTILIIDTDHLIVNAMDHLQGIEPTWILLKSDGTLNTYNDNIDIVVDFSTLRNRDILNDIIKIKQNQKIITISSELKCSVIKGCDFCIKNYNRRRLMKPIDIKTLHNTVKYFGEEECLYSTTNSFQNIELVLPTILNRFASYRYDQTMKILRPISHTNELYVTRDMINIIEILSTRNIKYSIINEVEIEII